VIYTFIRQKKTFIIRCTGERGPVPTLQRKNNKNKPIIIKNKKNKFHICKKRFISTKKKKEKDKKRKEKSIHIQKKKKFKPLLLNSYLINKKHFYKKCYQENWNTQIKRFLCSYNILNNY
jgi:hypothetical protein